MLELPLALLVRVTHAGYVFVAAAAPLMLLGAAWTSPSRRGVRALTALHLATLAWAAVQYGLELPCPLTALEHRLAGTPPAETFLPPLSASPLALAGVSAWLALGVAAQVSARRELAR